MLKICQSSLTMKSLRDLLRLVKSAALQHYDNKIFSVSINLEVIFR